MAVKLPATRGRTLTDMRSPAHPALVRAAAVGVGLTGAAMAAAGYAVGIERNLFTLRRFDVPVLAAGSLPLRLLHVSDLHLLPRQNRKRAWVRALADLDPDLVVNTGDNLAGPDAVPAVVEALGPLLDRPGAFVMGSNDYFGPQPKNPLRYFRPSDERVIGEKLPWLDLRDAFVDSGWVDLTNTRGSLTASGRTVALAGVDDPHLGRDRIDAVAGPADAAADVRLALSHSPEPSLVDRFVGDGYDLVLAGHTHGGQVRVPVWGAPVTNCGIDRDRSRWLSPWGAGFLHVSAGLGTSPYAPYRFACRPEATLLTLLPRRI